MREDANPKDRQDNAGALHNLSEHTHQLLTKLRENETFDEAVYSFLSTAFT